VWVKITHFFSLVNGIVKFERVNREKQKISVVPHQG
jgi:ribosomal protein L27